MNKIKKGSALLLVLVMILTMFPATAFAATAPNNLITLDLQTNNSQQIGGEYKANKYRCEDIENSSIVSVTTNKVKENETYTVNGLKVGKTTVTIEKKWGLLWLSIDPTYNVVVNGNITVTYDVNGGNASATPMTDVVKASGTGQNYVIDTTKYNATRDASSTSKYYFIGWNTDRNAKTGLTNLDLVKAQNNTGNVVLYAIWDEQKPTTINYVANKDGATVSVASDTTFSSVNGSSYTIDTTKFYATKAMDATSTYVFKGWSEKANNNNVVTQVTLKPDTKTLYGVWEKVDNVALVRAYDQNNNPISEVQRYAVPVDVAEVDIDQLAPTVEGKVFQRADVTENILFGLTTITRPVKRLSYEREWYTPGVWYYGQGGVIKDLKTWFYYHPQTIIKCYYTDAPLVEKVLTQITATAPTKTSYVEGQTFDPTGMVVSAIYSDGTNADIALTDCTFNPTILTKETTQITVTYQNQTATTPITVVEKAVTGIEVTTPPTKVQYVAGQQFDPTGMILTLTYNDETTEAAIEYGFTHDPLTVETTLVAIHYGEYSVTTPITVVEKAVTSIEVTTPPTKVQYVAGQQFDPAGMVLTLTYNDETTESAIEYGYYREALTAGTTSAEIYYGDYSTTTPITVVPKAVTGISVTTPPTTVNYIAGQTFNPAGMVVTATYNDGTTQAAIDYGYPKDALTSGTTFAAITYQNKTATTPITVTVASSGGHRHNTTNTTSSTTIQDETVPLAGTAELNKVDHFNYMNGYQDGTIKPLNDITREEVASIFYRMLTDDSRKIFDTQNQDFSDIKADRWSVGAIATLANCGIITGNSDGTFAATKPITRAEFAVVASRFDTLEENTDGITFSDISGNWAEKYIKSAVKKGWITGYSDGTFKPNQYITRAEAMALINRVLDRRVDAAGLVDGYKTFSDVKPTDWYYYQVIEATNNHDYAKRNSMSDTETWTKIKEDKTWTK